MVYLALDINAYPRNTIQTAIIWKTRFEKDYMRENTKIENIIIICYLFKDLITAFALQ